MLTVVCHVGRWEVDLQLEVSESVQVYMRRVRPVISEGLPFIFL